MRFAGVVEALGEHGLWGWANARLQGAVKPLAMSLGVMACVAGVERRR